MGINTIMGIAGGVLLVILIIIALIIRFKSCDSAKDKALAKEYLEGLKDEFYKKMIEIINNADISEYDTFLDFETSVLTDIYNTLYDYTVEKLKDSSEEDVLVALLLKVIDKKFVIDFIDEIMDNFAVADNIENAWSFKIENNIPVIEEEDKDLQEKYSSDEYVEDVAEVDLEPAEKIVPTEEELSKLNPQKDEVEDYDVENDSSVEVYNEEEELYYYDKRGRRHSKATGRYA